MDDLRFDSLAKALATRSSRRRIISGLLGISYLGAASRFDGLSASAASTVTWPFKPGHDQWAIVGLGYNPTNDGNHGDHVDYAKFALDFAKCAKSNVHPETRTCDINDGWATTTGTDVVSPVTGKIAWLDDPNYGFAIDIDGAPGYRIALFHVERRSHLDIGTPVTRGSTIVGKVTDKAGPNHGIGNHIHMALYQWTGTDGYSERTAVAYTGEWAIDGCSYAENEYHPGKLVPCVSVRPPSKPRITKQPSATVTATGVTITWATDIPSDSQGVYGTTTNYGHPFMAGADDARSHQVTATGLTPNTRYHYRVTSANDVGPATSGDRTFTTSKLNCRSGQLKCGNTCCPTPAHATATCDNGTCGFTCNAGYASCDGNPANGCETQLGTMTNCSFCGEACDDGNSCTVDTCNPTLGCSHLPLSNQTCTANGITGTCVAGRCISSDDYRVVLTWGAAPHDLDSHLWLPAATPYHVYYGDKGTTADFPWAELDLDDTTSYGPETITIVNLLAGTYTYAVYNYSGESPLATSGATVQLYQGGTLLKTYTVPSGSDERWWDVFRLASDGTVTDVNQLIPLGSSPGPYSAFAGTAQAQVAGAAGTAGAAATGIKPPPGSDQPANENPAPAANAPATSVCTAWETLCDGVCADLRADPANCGGCGVGCDGGACVNGACVAPAVGTPVG